MIVVDASILVELLLRHRPAGVAAEARLLATGETVHVPHLVDIEVASALRRSVLAGLVEPSRGREALDDFMDLPLQRYPHAVAAPLGLAREFERLGCCHVALAEALDAPLLTHDRRLPGAAGYKAHFELL
ncbi:MAG TPA: type II toxin-antitoxin system VapC family toxin [Stellaceae bacterium]|nr:type II toxin-antitoxin system VapC family toxin [Stellaceae bacterium]